jgi:hypothetical protein
MLRKRSIERHFIVRLNIAKPVSKNSAPQQTTAAPPSPPACASDHSPLRPASQTLTAFAPTTAAFVHARAATAPTHAVCVRECVVVAASCSRCAERVKRPFFCKRWSLLCGRLGVLQVILPVAWARAISLWGVCRRGRVRWRSGGLRGRRGRPLPSSSRGLG